MPRRILFTSVLAVSLMGSAGGCHHMAGVCDCEAPGSVGTLAPVAAAEPPLVAPTATKMMAGEPAAAPTGN